MKYVLFGVAAIGLLADISLPSRSIWHFIVLTLASSTWVVATIVVLDWTMTALNRSSPFMRKFYEEVRAELFNAMALSIILGIVFVGGHIPLLHGVDLAFIGLGLLLSSLHQLWKCIRLKVAGRHLPGPIVWALIWCVVIGIVCSAWMLRDVISEDLSTFQSLYLQATICCTSLYAFYFANLIRFYLQEERLEASPVLLKLGDDVFGSTFSRSIRLAEEQFNSAVQDFKKANRARITLKRRKKRKK